MAPRYELKERAKTQLGKSIFGSKWLMALLVCVIFAAIASIAGTVTAGIVLFIIQGPISYAQQYIFLKQSRDNQDVDISDVAKGFTSDFGGNFMIFLMTTIFTFLWSLLLVIPGIIKALSYSMAYRVKIDHPEYDWRACITESEKLMKGHKMEYFVLQLSFIGWLFVGAICFGIGTLWVAPYMEATNAHFYNELVKQPTVQ